MTIDLSDLGLRVMTQNTLRRAGIYTAAELADTPVATLSQMRLIGKATMAEITEALIKHNVYPTPVTAVSRQHLLDQLALIKTNPDGEAAHSAADAALLGYIGDAEISAAYTAAHPGWCA